MIHVEGIINTIGDEQYHGGNYQIFVQPEFSIL